MIHRMRLVVFQAAVALSLGLAVLGFLAPALWWALLVTLPLVILGLYDRAQTRHSLLRNYPIVGHLRFLLEDAGPELHQYLVESDTDGRPFDRDQRALIYERAKNVEDKKPFGTELDVYAPGYRWLVHSIAPLPKVERPNETLRVQVGGPQCRQPYSASVLNISAMSFGALSAEAIRALNRGARDGGFAHDTGEGGLSRHHLEAGGDVIWQIGTGYFGCRTPDGDFDPDLFQQQATHECVKMVEIKISQGAKPGHGGILPGAKVTAEIAEARGVPAGEDCFSPTYHRAFSTPLELVGFVARLRDLCGGKPVGFKLCVGDPIELLGICKAMLETDVLPDFIVVDGAEGGTGAAPLEFSDHVGAPLRDGLVLVRNALVATGLRDRIRLGASGKLVTGAKMATAMALGADWCNSARGFMFALGCIQSQRCHTNACPVGVATQDAGLRRALVVEDKARRVCHFHHNTVDSLAEVLAAMGLEHPSDLEPRHVVERVGPADVRRLDQIHGFLEPDQLLEGRAPEDWQRNWDRADAGAFRPR